MIIKTFWNSNSMGIKMILGFLISLSPLVFFGCASEGPGKPNIIFIYADDLGYGDLGCYGAKDISTPNLDRMAKEGAMFTQFYVTSPICSPSRTGLLTGRYQVRAGITRVFFPNSLQGIEAEEYTMAEMFRDKGYYTGIIGKWHLGHLPPYLPMEHGFDEWFGLPYSNDMTWEPRGDPPLPLMRNGQIIDQPTRQEVLTQRYTAEAIRFIAYHRNEPFFLYLPHTFPHNPLHVSKEFEGSSQRGIYGDVVQELDQSVGEIFHALEELDLDENTLVLFSSDNGPSWKFGGETGGLRGWKATTFEGGIRIPMLAWWKGHISEGLVIKEPAIMMDWMPTFAEITGAELPDDRKPDGISILPLLKGESIPGERDFYFYYLEDLRALRSGKWKYKKAVLDDPYHQKALDPHDELLFDLESDPFETNNLAGSQPEILSVMQGKMKDFLENLGEVPEPKIKEIPYEKPSS